MSEPKIVEGSSFMIHKGSPYEIPKHLIIKAKINREISSIL